MEITADRSKVRSLNPTTTIFFIVTPLLTALSLWFYTRASGVHVGDIILFLVMLAFSGLSITAGYHRLYAHRTYRGNRFMQVFYLLAGAASFEQSALVWASDHRNHHKFVDQDQDPYNIKKGFFWAHIGWIFHVSPPRDFQNAPDLTSDPLVMLQHRYYVPIASAVCFVLPMLAGLCYGHPFGGLLWGGLLRMVVFHHLTFLINSAAHVVGNQPYSNKHSGRDSWWLALFIFGEGFHNYHHTFPGDYRLGIRWWQFDPGKWLIRASEALGLASHVNRTSPRRIENALASTQSVHAMEQMALPSIEEVSAA